jgi:hypothetical protein
LTPHLVGLSGGRQEARFSSLEDGEWDKAVARQLEHQAHIEAVFDRADACGELGDLELALGWLARADALSGGLSLTYRAQRSRWARELSELRMPVAGKRGPRPEPSTS